MHAFISQSTKEGEEEERTNERVSVKFLLFSIHSGKPKVVIKNHILYIVIASRNSDHLDGY